eukprot:g1884.t1
MYRPLTGLHPSLVDAFSRAGFETMLPAQNVAIPQLLRDSSLPHPHRVLAAETGSGKTLAYLSVMMHDMMGSTIKTPSDSSSERRRKNAIGLILCPNTALCMQVKETAEIIQARARELSGSDDGNDVEKEMDGAVVPAVPRVEILSGMVAPAAEDTLANRNVLYVSTPSALVQHISNFYDNGHQQNFVKRLTHVVFDEADALLTGGYEASIRRLFVLLAYGDVKSRGVEMSDRKDFGKFLGRMNHKIPEQYRDRRRFFFVAATLSSKGKKSPGAIIDRAFPDTTWVDQSPLLHRGFGNDAVTFDWRDMGAVPVDEFSVGLRSVLWDVVSSRSSQRRETDIERNNEVDDGGDDDGNGVDVTLVFCRTAARADAIAKMIETSAATSPENKGMDDASTRIACMPYHGRVDGEKRDAWLRWLRTGDETARDAACVAPETTSAVLCCTDTAARGLDIPSVSCVVQADFAANAIDFVHRVGRTGRAGKPGHVVSLFTPNDADLVHVIRDSMDRGMSLEHAFSRRRSFKKGIKQSRRGGRRQRGGDYEGVCS